MARLTHQLDAAWLDLVDKLYDIERYQDDLDHEEFLFHVKDVFGYDIEESYDDYYRENENG
jgi:hypothetical protein